MKGKPDIVALEDHEYPDWLWTLLDDSAKKSSDAGGVDVACTFHNPPFVHSMNFLGF